MNAVTVWMLIAQGIDRRMTGLIHWAGARPAARPPEADAGDEHVEDR